MKSLLRRLPEIPRPWLKGGVVLLAAIVVLATFPMWWTAINALADRVANEPATDDAVASAESEHAHAHQPHAPSITLSPEARKSVGLRVAEIQPGPYERFLSVPALVTERPGQSRYEIVAPFTGIVTAVNIVPGQMVSSSNLLFTLRLTHEDLVKAQKEFLATLGQLDVERRELQRLKQINSSVMARKVLLEKEYQIETLEAALNAQRNALHLHGLTMSQIEMIENDRTLVRELKVFVPFLHPDASVHGPEESGIARVESSQSPSEHELVKQEFLIQDLDIRPGQAVETGKALCHLVNYQTLFIEGRAFERDAPAIREAAEAHRGVQAIPEGQDARTSLLRNLPIVRIANQIDRESRALLFYVEVPNRISVLKRTADNEQNEKRQFATWRFKPGQRMRLRVPVDVWEDVYVLPVEAVAQEGLETYAFVQNGKKFERRAVHVLYRDQVNVVLAKDAFFPQESIVQNAAHQLLIAIKNKGGGGADAHHGHMH